MSDWVLMFIRDLALAVWLGGLVVIDFVEAPAKFKVAAINRNQAVAVGRAVFAALLRLEVALGVLLIVVHLLVLGRANAEAHASRWRDSLFAAALMLALALLQKFWVLPLIQQASEAVDLVARTSSAEVFARMTRWHVVYVVGDLMKIALGVIALALWTN